MGNIFGIISKATILSPRGLWHLTATLIKEGANMSVLTAVGAKLYGDREAIVCDDLKVSYNELNEAVKRTAKLYHLNGVKPKQRIAILTKNSLETIYSIFGVARLGADIFLINSETPENQLIALKNRYRFDLIINSTDITKNDIGEQIKLPRSRFNRLVVLTSGTTGTSKAASRKTSIGAFLPAFISLLTKLQLTKYRKVYIATPLHHGFGIATLCVSLAMGNESYILERFEADAACSLIKTNDIEAVTLVPTMLGRMMEGNEKSLSRLKCIISGGAPLSGALADRVLHRLGDILFNLYGTSEGGVAMMATPETLRQNSSSIGRPLAGVSARVNGAKSSTDRGEIEIRSRWSVGGKWSATGDIGYKDGFGNWFLLGRVDDMIVSGGVNVYPCELETVLSKHSELLEVAVIGVNDDDFGQRLHAFVVLKNGAILSNNELKRWITNNASRHQIPREITILEAMPHNTNGKIDKHHLATIL